jgi:hypothetical protein
MEESQAISRSRKKRTVRFSKSEYPVLPEQIESSRV